VTNVFTIQLPNPLQIAARQFGQPKRTSRAAVQQHAEV